MKNYKKISAATLALAMAAGLIPGLPAANDALAAPAVTNYYYTDFNDTVTDSGVVYNKAGRLSNIATADLVLGENGERIDWMDFDGTLVISYDALLPKSGDALTDMGSYSGWLRQTWYENGTEKTSPYHHYIESLGHDRAYAFDTKGLVADGNPSAPGQDLGTGNALVSWGGVHHMYTTSYSDFSERRWATLTIVGERDDSGTKFNKGQDVILWKAYIDGELIYSPYGKSEVYQRPDKCRIGGTPAYEFRVKNAPDDINITYGYPSIQFSSVSDSDNKLLDNYKISVYGGTELEKAVAIEPGETAVEIPVINNAIDSTAPAGARAGQIKDYVKSVSESAISIKAVKYSADDVFMTNGKDVSKQVKAKAQNPNTETIDSPSRFAGTAKLPTNGDTVFATIPALAEGERLEITVSGAKDIKGNELASNRTVIVAGKALGGISATNNFGGAVEFKNGKIDTDVKTMTVAYPDSQALKIVKENGDGVTTATVSSGITHKFTFDRCLESEQVYKVVTNSGEVLFTFNTKTDKVDFGEAKENESNTLSVPYVNTNDEQKNVTVVGYSREDDVMVDVVTSDATLDARSFGEVSLDRALATASTQDAFVLTAEEKNATPASDNNVIRATVFDDNHKATVTGSLADDSYRVVAYASDGSIKYANRIEAEGGKYEFTLNMDGFATDTYELVIYTDKGSYSTVVAHSQNWDGSILDGASQSELEDIFGNADTMSSLEFAYPLFNELSPAQKEKVAAYLADSLGDINLNQKASTIGAFRTATIMVALSNSSTAAKAENFIADASVFEDSNVEKWYYDTTNVVDSSRTDKWQEGTFKRLASYAQKNNGFKDIADFENKFVEALVYEVIANHGSTPILVGVMGDFENDYIKAGDAATEKALNKLSEDEKSYTNLDGFKTLKKDLKTNEEGGKQPPGGGGGGGGSTPKKEDVPAVELPQATVQPSGDADEDLTEYKKSSFADMEDHNWAVDYVEALYEKKILDGVGDKKFAPGETVTREAFVKLIVNALDVPAPEEAVELPFADVLPDSWFNEFVTKAYGNGIINGISDTMFGTGNNVTRQDMAVIIYNAMATEDDGEAADTSVFTDGASIADYAQKAVCTLAKMGIINGYDDGSFNPNGNATRAEAAKVIYMVLDSIAE